MPPKTIKNSEEANKIFKIRQKTISKLWDFISDRVEKDTKKQTHMWFGNGFDKVMFRVEDDDYEEFVNLVSETTQNILKYNDMEALHLLELPKEIGVFNLDLDIKFTKKNSHTKYIEPLNIIEKLNKIIKTYFVLNKNNNELISYYLLKDEPFFDDKKKLYSEGIHISYPNLILNCEDKNFILDLLIEEIITKGDMDELINVLLTEDFQNKKLMVHFDDESNNYIDENNNVIDITEKKKEIINSIFDRRVFKSTKWFMYGSGKELYKNKHVYKVRYIYDSNCNELEEENYPTNDNLVKILAIRYPNEKQTLPNDLPRPNKKVEKTISTIAKNDKNKKVVDNVYTKHDIELSKKLIKMLSKDRAGPYESWMKVGVNLYQISDTLLPEFIEFSKQSESFDLAGCNKFWSTCKKYGEDKNKILSILKFWAKEDNAEEYDKLYNEYLNTCSLEDSDKIKEILQNINFEEDYQVAKLIHSLYKRKFICASISTKSWFQFSNHRWHYCDAGYKLDNIISEHFSKYVRNMYEQLTKKHLDDIHDENIKKKKDAYYKFLTKLNKTIYKNNLMSECSKIFYEEGFEFNLDENIELVGFENGVYDLKKKEFRDGLPEDKISFSTGYNYNMDYNMEHPDIIEVEKIIKSIQPNDEIRTFMLAHIASILKGGNRDQIIVFWIGPGGSNGKSTMEKFVEYAFGSYCQQMENTVLTRPRPGSSAPTPELSNKKGVRITLIHEPEQSDKIYGGTLKQFTGQDRITTRGLYEKKQVSFIPQFKMILIANYFSEFTSVNDKAVWRRIKAIEFNQKFTEKPNPKNPNEHKIDKDLVHKLEYLKGAFMWILLNKYYPLYEQKGLDALTPTSINNYTKKYEETAEPYLKYSEEQISFNPDGEMLVTELKQNYIDWYLGEYACKPQKPGGIVDFFVDKGCVKKGKLIKGITYCELDTNIDNMISSELDG
jgi:P4 family phage/plasmid primase-like protien